MPVVFSFKSDSSYIWPKRAFAETLVSVLWILVLVPKLLSEEFVWRLTGLEKFVLLFLAYRGLEFLWAPDIYRAWETFFQWGAGLSLILLIPQILAETDKEKFFRTFVTGLGITTAIAAVYGILQFYGIDFPYIMARGRLAIISFFGNPNFFSGFLIGVAPAFLGVALLFDDDKKALPWILLYLLIYAGITVTQTRGAWLGWAVSTAIMLAVMAIFNPRFFKKRAKRIGIIFLGVLVIFLVYSFPNPINVRKISAAGRVKAIPEAHTGSGRYRLFQWETSFYMIKDSPIIGQGLGSFIYKFVEYQVKTYERLKGSYWPPYTIPRRAHNDYIQVLAEEGMVGFVLFAVLMLAWLRMAVKIAKRFAEEDNPWFPVVCGMAACVVAIATHALFSFPMKKSDTVQLWFMWMTLTALAPYLFAGEELKTFKVRVKPLVGGLVACAVLVAFTFAAVWGARPYFASVSVKLANAYGRLVGKYSGERAKLALIKAEEHYQKALKLLPWEGEFWAERGLTQLRFAEKVASPEVKIPYLLTARQYLERARKNYTDWEIDRTLGAIALKLSRTYRELAKRAKNPAAREKYERWAEEEFETAKGWLEKVVRERPDHALAWYLLGAEVYPKLGEKEKALKALENALRYIGHDGFRRIFEPEYPLAKAYYLVKPKFGKIRGMTELAIEKGAKAEWVFDLYILACHGSPELELEAYKIALKNAPKSESLWIRYIRFLERQKATEEVKRALREALERFPKSPFILSIARKYGLSPAGTR